MLRDRGIMRTLDGTAAALSPQGADGCPSTQLCPVSAPPPIHSGTFLAPTDATKLCQKSSRVIAAMAELVSPFHTSSRILQISCRHKALCQTKKYTSTC
ncbi:hypothetical protein E2C01_014346 [Portunus trituberculatus]|uniref:Uncharacterized protein n=1 Tax=Portunus trituberculatus TaxID=210409 RepID=A0A5B7DJQ6_PORTR|nr:hypothetical protein [Portunus trituberculatus]